MLFVILSENVKQLNYSFREKKHITNLKTSTIVFITTSLKGDQGFFLNNQKEYSFPRLLQTQFEAKFNVFNFSIDGYAEYVANMLALPVKAKFGENRR